MLYNPKAKIVKREGNVDIMINVNITSFRRNVFNLLEQTIKWGEPLNMSSYTIYDIEVCPK